MDDDTLKARVATGKGGSNWNVSSNAESGKTTQVERDDADAFNVKLYPAGTILHMVLVDDEPEGNVDAAEGTSEPTRPANRHYEMFADVSVQAYDKIRLSKTMLSDHFLPKYLEALSDVRARLVPPRA